MATPVQGLAPRKRAAAAATEIPELDDDLILIDIKTRAALKALACQQKGAVVKPAMGQILPDTRGERALAPLYLLAVLVLFFIVSPLLPIGVREYISALVR